MYQRMMVPLDGSAFSECAIPLALRLAQRAGSTLTLVTIAEPSGLSVEDCRAYLERVSERLRADFTGEIEVIVPAGQVVQGLLEAQASTGGELTVMATHGRGGLSRMWLGSVASGFLHQTERPLILVRPEDGEQPIVHWGFAKLCVPLDGTPLSEGVLEHAIEFGRMFDAAYHLTRIVLPPTDFGSPYAPPVVAVGQELLEAAQVAASQYLESHAAPLRAAGLRVTTEVRVGPQAGRGILDEVEASGCDSIAMATHGRIGLGRAILGSAADKVLRGAHVPVLLYRPHLVARAEAGHEGSGEHTNVRPNDASDAREEPPAAQ